jgi:hypothetical protein
MIAIARSPSRPWMCVCDFDGIPMYFQSRVLS